MRCEYDSERVGVWRGDDEAELVEVRGCRSKAGLRRGGGGDDEGEESWVASKAKMVVGGPLIVRLLVDHGRGVRSSGCLSSGQLL